MAPLMAATQVERSWAGPPNGLRRHGSSSIPGVDSDYRLAPPFAVRLVGGALVLVAVLVFAGTFVAALAGWSLAGVLGIGAGGLLAVLGTAVWLRRVTVVHFDAEGYRVRLVRGVGVAAAAWTEVDEAVAADAPRRAVHRAAARGRADQHHPPRARWRPSRRRSSPTSGSTSRTGTACARCDPAHWVQADSAHRDGSL